MRQSQDGATYAAFVATAVIGGANYIAVSFSNHELPPLFGATLRFALATICFIFIARMRRVPPARGPELRGAALYGLLSFGASYACFYYALVGLAAGTVAVVAAAVPLFTLFIAAALGQERLSARGLVGGLLAVGGIAVLSGGALEGELGPSYLLAALLGTATAAGSSVVAKGLPQVHPTRMNAIGMLSGTTLLAAGSLLLGESWELPREGSTLAAIAWLVLAGSVGLFQLFLHVIQRWTASATMYSITAMPVVAVALGALLLDQPITHELLLGGGLVIAAVYVGAIASRRG